MRKKLKVGVLGIKRGTSFVASFENNRHTELVAVCDFNKLSTQQFLQGKKNITAYEDYDKFLEHDMDAVVICGYCTEHAPQAVKALQAGKHVLSEITACKTLAEGVALCRAVEKSGKVYMYGENYCYFAYTQEMQRLYRKGVVGEYLYGECEYVHDCRPTWKALTDGPDHWRNWIPSTYYCTHSLGPIITITGTRPLKVSGFVVPNTLSRQVGKKGDDWGMFICTMDNNALTRVIPWATGPHDSIWYRVHGTKGAMENNRWKDTEKLNIYLQKTIGRGLEKNYLPVFSRQARKAEKAGHGGSDFFVVWDFVQAILKKEKPPIDVYMAMDMTLPGILAYRSALDNNFSVEVPDFRREEVRKKYENNDWSPDPKDKRKGQPFPSVLGEIKIPDSVYEFIKKRRL